MIFSILTVVFITELCKLIEALKKRIKINGHKKGKKANDDDINNSDKSAD